MLGSKEFGSNGYFTHILKLKSNIISYSPINPMQKTVQEMSLIVIQLNYSKEQGSMFHCNIFLVVGLFHHLNLLYMYVTEV